jgi:multiple sugar transport system substrate-binding protein
MRLNDDFMREMSDKRTILDLNQYTADLDKSQYFENVFDFSDLPNGRAGLAIGTSPRVLFINKTMFEKKGVPLPPTTWTSEGWTWDDYLETAKALTGDGDFGTILVKDTAFENTWATNNGGDGIFSEDGRRFTLADPEGIEAMQWAADLALKHEVSPTWAEIAPDQADQRLFAAGRVGMYFSAMPVAGYLADNVNDFEWDIAPIPAKVNQYSEGSMIVQVIPQAAKDPEGAWEFLKFITGEEGGTFFAERRTCVPLHRKAADALATASPDTAPENVRLFIDAADHNRSVNSTTATSAAVALYRPQLQRALIGEISVEEALTSVRDQVEAAIA